MNYLSAIKLMLENNIFHYNNSRYRPLKETSMGTKMTPIYAALVLGYLELKLFTKICKQLLV